MNQPNFDLDKFVDMRSISRCGRKFNPENLLPRSEITKLRPILKESDKILDSKANTKEANRILQEINQLKVNKEHGAKDQISKVNTRDASPPPGNYIPKYGFVMKRPQTNMFTKSQRFKDLNFPQDTFDHSQQLSLINQSLMNNPANRSQLSRSIVKHERTVVTQSNLENSIDLINQSKSRELSQAKKHLILQNKSQIYENYLTQSVGGVSTMLRSRPLLCVSFDKQVARKQLIDGYQSPHEERFKYRSFIQSKLQDLSFDKQTIRKNEALNSGATCLDYDYSKTLDKVKFDSTIQKVLPFQREKIDYQKFYKKIDLTKIKKPVDILKGRALRRKINFEDDSLIFNLVIKPKIIQQIKIQQAQVKPLTLEELFQEYDNQNKVDKK
eukprot:403339306